MQTTFGIHMKGGVITERDADFCTVRIRAPAGVLSVEQIRGIATIAKRYGNGNVHCTTRQTLEIPHVSPARLKKLERALERTGRPSVRRRTRLSISSPARALSGASLPISIPSALHGKSMRNSSARRCRSRCGSRSPAARMPARAPCSTRSASSGGSARSARPASVPAAGPASSTARRKLS